MKLEGKVSGFDELDKLLKQLPRNVERRVLQKGTTAAMRSILPDMKAAAPRHDGERSPASKKYGTLLSNIRAARLRRVRKGEKGTRISTGNAFWGFIYEKGSRYQPARPWFAPTFRRLQSKLIKVLGTEIGKGIEQEAAKSYRGGRR